MTPAQAKLAALDKIIAAVRAYLPPDGMSAEQFISTVIEAVDNPEFNVAMEASMSIWERMKIAPTDGRVIRLKGRFAGDNKVVEVDGLYEAGGYTEGWVDADRHNTFYPDAWREKDAGE